MLERLLKSSARVKALGVVLASDGLHLREIARRAEISPSEAKAALDNFVSMGLLSREAKGNLSLFSKNAKCSFLSEMKAIYLKTEGVVPLLAAEIGKLRGLRYALIYGSYASGTYRERSDVDVLVIGEVAAEELDGTCFKVQNLTQAEINYILWSSKDFTKKLAEGGAFIKSILAKKRVWLAGDEDEFGRAAEKGRNRRGKTGPGGRVEAA